MPCVPAQTVSSYMAMRVVARFSLKRSALTVAMPVIIPSPGARRRRNSSDMIMWRAGSTNSPISNQDPASIISARHSRWVILPLAWRLSTHSLRFSSAPIACSSKNSCSRSGM